MTKEQFKSGVKFRYEGNPKHKNYLVTQTVFAIEKRYGFEYVFTDKNCLFKNAFIIDSNYALDCQIIY